MGCAIIVKQVIAGCSAAGSALDWGSRGREFKSRHSDHIGTQVLIRYLRSFSFYQKTLGARLFVTFANEICYIVSKLNTQKSKRSDLNLHVFHPYKSQ